MTSKSLSKNDINKSDEIKEEEDSADATDLQSFLIFTTVISKNNVSVL